MNIKKQKIIQVFSNGSLNICYSSLFDLKKSQIVFFERDIKIFCLEIKQGSQNLHINNDESIKKKYSYLKNV